MKSKFLSLLLVFTLILPISVTAPAAAAQAASIVDFTNDDAAFTLVNSGVDPWARGGQIVKGQYGKSPNDASYRLFSGGSATGYVGDTRSNIALTVDNADTSVASDGQYYHLGFQFLNEDNLSTITASISYISGLDGSTCTEKILSEPRDAANKIRPYIFSTSAAYRWDGTIVFGAWNQVDFYFSADSLGSNVIMSNGNAKPDIAYPSGKHSVAKINSITFTHTATYTTNQTKDDWEKTGAQIDNVVFEVVDDVPSAHDNYRYSGEKFDFDDGVVISGGKYTLPYYYSGAWMSGASGIDVSFGSDTANTIVSGKFGRPSWDKSLHTEADTVGSAMSYTPKLSPLAAGDAPQLTFAIANATADSAAGVKATGAMIDGTDLDDISLFEMSSAGTFAFFGEDTGEQWSHSTWYKADIVFDISASSTTADCYIDGELLCDDYVLSDGAMSTIGTLAFTDTPGADYYLDDIAFASPNADPQDGYALDTFDPDLFEAIDNDNRVITVPGSYKAEDFLAKLANPETVTLYNSAGAIVYSGLLPQCAVKVSNTFGAGVWYTVETTGEVIPASLFDIADGSAVIAAEVDTLNVDASGEDSPVIKTDIFIDGKLYDSTNSDTASIDLSSLMLGAHTFEAYAYINSKDCYMDSVELALVEQVHRSIIAAAANDFETYTGGDYKITKGDFVEQAWTGSAEQVVDSSGIHHGTSAVFVATAANEALGTGYIIIKTPESDNITKAELEFDLCMLSDQASISIGYEGAGVNGGSFGKNGKLGDEYTNLGTNRWYHIKSVFDVKNRLMSLYIDGDTFAENIPVAPTSDKLNNRIKLNIQYSMRGLMASSGIDSCRLLAIDNIALSAYDELAYVKSVEGAGSSDPVDYTSNVLKVTMSAPVDEVSANMLSLHSANGERAVESVAIDENDATILYVTPKYKLSSADVYKLVIDSGLKSCGQFSTKANCGFFVTSPKSVDVLTADFKTGNTSASFTAKLTNTTESDKELIIIGYVYEGSEFKGICAKTVTVKAGRNLTDTVYLPYYSPTAKLYGLVTDSWDDMKPITNKLYQYGF